jgi:hypothetical protein
MNETKTFTQNINHLTLKQVYMKWLKKKIDLSNLY